MKYFLLIAFCGATCRGYAQAQPNPFAFKTALSFNPSTLASLDHTAMFGVEHRLKNRLALLLDAGYVFASTSFNDGRGQGVSGYALRPGVKWYRNTETDASFIFQIFYKQVNHKLTDWLGKACVDNIPAYEQLQTFVYRRQTLSFNLMAGQVFRITDGVLLELYGGLGMKLREQRAKDKTCCYLGDDNDLFRRPNDRNQVFANLPFGVKITVPVQ